MPAIKTKSFFDWRKVIKHSSLYFSYGYASYNFPYHKTDCFFMGSEVMFAHHDVTDPVKLLYQYTTQHNSLHSARFALFLCHNGSVPTCAWFDSKLSTFVNRSYGGHSARAGDATFYASLGLSENIIMAIGHWTSEAWKSYLRDNHSVQAELQLACLKRKYQPPLAIHDCHLPALKQNRVHT